MIKWKSINRDLPHKFLIFSYLFFYVQNVLLYRKIDSSKNNDYVVNFVTLYEFNYI